LSFLGGEKELKSVRAKEGKRGFVYLRFTPAESRGKGCTHPKAAHIPRRKYTQLRSDRWYG